MDVISFLPSYSIAHAHVMLNDDLVVLLNITYTVELKIINAFSDISNQLFCNNTIVWILIFVGIFY